jgi:HEAT repeat protein
MNHTLTTLVAALALSGAAIAQAPTTPARPAAPARTPSAPAKPAPAVAADHEDREPTADEELALAALEGLMAQPGDRALPIIKKVLAGQQSTLIKKRALFVLSQIHAPEAQQLLAQTARSGDAGMRGEAIRAIGIGGNRQALDSLQEIYNSGEGNVKGEVLQAWLIAGRTDLVYQAATNAKTEDEASDAIRILGAMGATEELRKLGDRPNAPRGLVEAYAVSGDLASLRKIAEGNGERGMRVDAVRKIGIIHSDAARAALRELYASSDPEIREAALQGMLISGDEHGVLALYRAAKSSEEKRKLLRTLSMIDGDAALEAIDAALEGKK